MLLTTYVPLWPNISSLPPVLSTLEQKPHQDLGEMIISNRCYSEGPYHYLIFYSILSSFHNSIHFICAGSIAIWKHVKQMFVVFACRSIKFPDLALFCCVSMYSMVCRCRRSLLLCSVQSIVVCICECLCYTQAYLDIKVCLCVFVLGFSFCLWALLLVWPLAAVLLGVIFSLIINICAGKKAWGEGKEVMVKSLWFVGCVHNNGR